MARDTSALHTEDLRELAVLEAMERNPAVSQRALAQELGVAVGAVNACVRTLTRKGLIKIRGESNRSITYHLTHEGALRKAALAVQWTRNTLAFYRDARGKVAEQLAALAAAGHTRAVLYGANELAEIAVLVASGGPLVFVAAIPGNDAPVGSQILGVPVDRIEVPDADVDLVLLSEIAPPAAIAELQALFSTARIESLLGQPVEEGVV